jgi:hypothetical protein
MSELQEVKEGDYFYANCLCPNIAWTQFCLGFLVCFTLWSASLSAYFVFCPEYERYIVKKNEKPQVIIIQQPMSPSMVPELPKSGPPNIR